MLIRCTVLATILTTAALAQELDPAGWQSKLRFHAANVYSPASLAGSAAFAGFPTAAGRGWETGEVGYGNRLGAGLAYTGVRNAIGFGLDSALHQDPRYYRSQSAGTWSRVKHAFRGTVLTRTDSGGETLSTWRLGSAYGGALLTNRWYPGRVDTVSRGLAQGSTQIGFDLLNNLASEFWPDVKKTILRRKP